MALVAAVALALVITSRSKRYYFDLHYRPIVQDWIAEVQSHEGGVVLSTPIDSDSTGNRRMLTVANGEMVCSDDPAIGQGWSLPSNPKTKDGYLYFVLPPGKWVRTVDEILDEWYRNPNGHLQ